MAVAQVSRVGETITVRNTDGDIFTYMPAGPDWKRLALVSVFLADEKKEPEAYAAATQLAADAGMIKP